MPRSEQALPPPIIDWGVAGSAIPGQVESGDRHVIAEVPDGVLVGVVDGLGHGPEAAVAANTAIATLVRSPDAPIEDLVVRCHERLVGSRGVVMSLAFIPRHSTGFTWLGVGNVEGVLFTAQDPPRHLLLSAGVVGHRLPPLRVGTVQFHLGDILLFATDGLDPRFADQKIVGATPRAIAKSTLRRYRIGTDDALVVAIRWNGEGIDDGTRS